METKICSKCGIKKLVSEFSDDKSRKDGLSYVCKLCKRADYSKYYLCNKEKVNDTHKNYQIKNKDAVSKYKKEYYSINKEKIKRYRLKIKEKILEHNKNYIKNISDSYARAIVKKQTSCTNPHPELIKLKRVQIQIKRFLKENSV